MVAMPKLSRDTTERLMTFLFTDLHGSTALYERMGDVVAYEVVRQHFAFLAAIVRGHNGMVVKTIGDAVMAAFDSPVDAVKAALAMQAGNADFNRAHPQGDARLAMKLGVHCGGSVEVELDHGLDYFGSAVNLAARLRGHSQDGDVVLSGVVAEHPAIRQVLATFPTRAESLPFKGFNGLVHFVRVMQPIRHSIGHCAPLTFPFEPTAGTSRAAAALGRN